MNVLIEDGEIRRRLLDELLGPLQMHFFAAAQAYRDYLENGRTFLFACTLRRTNSSARKLLLRRGHLLPVEMLPDVLAILRHYDVWLTQWNDLASRVLPGPRDSFVFQSEVKFPKDAQLRINSLYDELTAIRN